MRSSLLLAGGGYNTPGFLEDKATGRERLAAPQRPGRFQAGVESPGAELPVDALSLQ